MKITASLSMRIAINDNKVSIIPVALLSRVYRSNPKKNKHIKKKS